MVRKAKFTPACVRDIIFSLVLCSRRSLCDETKGLVNLSASVSFTLCNNFNFHETFTKYQHLILVTEEVSDVFEESGASNST